MKVNSEWVSTLLEDTVAHLCQNCLTYNHQLKVQGLLGITVDKQVFLVHFNKLFEQKDDDIQVTSTIPSQAESSDYTSPVKLEDELHQQHVSVPRMATETSVSESQDCSMSLHSYHPSKIDTRLALKNEDDPPMPSLLGSPPSTVGSFMDPSLMFPQMGITKNFSDPSLSPGRQSVLAGLLPSIGLSLPSLHSPNDALSSVWKGLTSKRQEALPIPFLEEILNSGEPLSKTVTEESMPMESVPVRIPTHTGLNELNKKPLGSASRRKRKSESSGMTSDMPSSMVMGSERYENIYVKEEPMEMSGVPHTSHSEDLMRTTSSYLTTSGYLPHTSDLTLSSLPPPPILPTSSHYGSFSPNSIARTLASTLPSLSPVSSFISQSPVPIHKNPKPKRQRKPKTSSPSSESALGETVAATSVASSNLVPLPGIMTLHQALQRGLPSVGPLSMGSMPPLPQPLPTTMPPHSSLPSLMMPLDSIISSASRSTVSEKESFEGSSDEVVPDTLLGTPRKRKSSPRELPCPECRSKFATVERLQRHISTVHWQRERVTCDICGSSFSGKPALTNHRKAEHFNRTINCRICGKGFKWYSSLRFHLKKSHKILSATMCSTLKYQSAEGATEPPTTSHSPGGSTNAYVFPEAEVEDQEEPHPLGQNPTHQSDPDSRNEG